MPEKHELSFDGWDLRVNVNDDGDVDVSFHEAGKCVFSCDWDTIREAIEFIGTHGLKIDNPWFGPYSETVEGAAQERELV